MHAHAHHDAPPPIPTNSTCSTKGDIVRETVAAGGGAAQPLNGGARIGSRVGYFMPLCEVHWSGASCTLQRPQPRVSAKVRLNHRPRATPWVVHEARHPPRGAVRPSRGARGVQACAGSRCAQCPQPWRTTVRGVNSSGSTNPDPNLPSRGGSSQACAYGCMVTSGEFRRG